MNFHKKCDLFMLILLSLVNVAALWLAVDKRNFEHNLTLSIFLEMLILQKYDSLSWRH